MTAITRSHTTHLDLRHDATGDAVTVPMSFAVLLAAAIGAVVWAPPALVLPALALVATVLATITGAAGWLIAGRGRAGLLTSAGVFALAAGAAAMLGDPDKVALLAR